MSKREIYEQKTEAFILPILEREGFELVDVEFVKEGGEYYLRCYIDKEGGINIDDCVLVSQEMNEILDREDYVDEEYIFEVSSPGLGRPLKKDKDYVRNTGKEVDIKTYRAIDGNKEFRGVLTAFDNASVTVEIDGEEKTFDKKDIALIREAVDF